MRRALLVCLSACVPVSVLVAGSGAGVPAPFSNTPGSFAPGGAMGSSIVASGGLGLVAFARRRVV